MTTWSLRPEDRRRRTWRGLGAALLSVLLPGLGQLVLGRRARAAAFLGGAALVGVAVARVAAAPGMVMELVLAPGSWTWLLGTNLALLAFRLVAAADAYHLGARPPAIPPTPRTVPAAIGTGLAMVAGLAVLGAPHALAAYATVRTAEVVDTVFEGADGVPATQEPAADPERPATPRPEPVDPEDLPRAPGNPWIERDRVTVAVLGSDAGPGRVGHRLDAILVATVEPSTGHTAVVSIDRYLADFPLPEHLADVYADHCLDGEGWQYLNALYTCGRERIGDELREHYPEVRDPAAAAVADTLAELFDLDIDHHVFVDMGGFVGVVDALGGVELELASPLTVRMSPATPDGEWRTYSLEEGHNVLDGEEALAYVRVRGSGGDARRMERQRCFVAAAVDDLDAPSLLRGFPGLADAIEEHVTTDVPAAELPALLRLLLEVELSSPVTAGFGPPEFRGPDHVPDVDAIRDRMAELLVTDADDAGEDAEVAGGDGACP